MATVYQVLSSHVLGIPASVSPEEHEREQQERHDAILEEYYQAVRWNDAYAHAQRNQIGFQ